MAVVDMDVDVVVDVVVDVEVMVDVDVDVDLDVVVVCDEVFVLPAEATASRRCNLCRTISPLHQNLHPR